MGRIIIQKITPEWTSHHLWLMVYNLQRTGWRSESNEYLARRGWGNDTILEASSPIQRDREDSHLAWIPAL